jgi:hypothetical protein
MSASSIVTALPGKRRSRGGRKSGEHLRCARVTMTIYPADESDLEMLSRHFDCSLSTFTWAVVHDWLQSQRPRWSELGEVRGALRSGLELALRDAELRPWLLGLIREGSER